MIKVGIIGGAGYTAGELIRLLINHPDVEIISFTVKVTPETKLPTYIPACSVKPISYSPAKLLSTR